TVSPRIVTRRLLDSPRYDMQTSFPSSAHRRPLVHSVSANQSRLLVSTSRHPVGKHRIFRSNLSRERRGACKFFRHCVSRRVSWQQDTATRSFVLAWRGHVALRWHGMAGPIGNRIGLSLNGEIAKWKYNSPAYYARAAWRALDVRARSSL